MIQVAASLEEIGVSPERVLRQAGLPMWHFCEPDDLIPARHTYLFMEHAARAAGTEAFGLRVGEGSSFESLGTFGKAISRALTTRHAVETFCRLVPRFSSVSSFWLAEDGDALWLCRRLDESIETGRRQMEQYALMQMIKAVRLGACPGWIPARIALRSDPQPAMEQAGALAGAEIRYQRAVTAIAIPRAVLAREVRRAMDGAAQPILEKTYVPNHVVAKLSLPDLKRLEGLTVPLVDEVLAFLREHAQRNGYERLGAFALELQPALTAVPDKRK